MNDEGYYSRYVIVGPDKELRQLYNYLHNAFGHFDNDNGIYLEDFLKSIDMLPEEINVHTGYFVPVRSYCDSSSLLIESDFVQLRPISSLNCGSKLTGDCVYLESVDYYEQAAPVVWAITQKIAPNCVLYYIATNECQNIALSNDVNCDIFANSDYLISTDIEPGSTDEFIEDETAQKFYSEAAKYGDLDRYFSEQEIREMILKLEKIIGIDSFDGSNSMEQAIDKFFNKVVEFPFDFFIYSVDKDIFIETFESFAENTWGRLGRFRHCCST